MVKTKSVSRAQSTFTNFRKPRKLWFRLILEWEHAKKLQDNMLNRNKLCSKKAMAKYVHIVFRRLLKCVHQITKDHT